MGFFSNIFKRKEGGTFVGNLIRGAASTATGGVLGSGAGLARWEAEKDAKEKQALTNELADLRASINGKQFGSDLVNSAVNVGLAGKQTDPNVGESIVLTTLKKHWYWFLGAAVVIVGLIWFIMTNKKGSNKHKFRR